LRTASHFPYETVSAAGDCNDPLGACRGFAKGFPQSGDGDRNIVLFDGGVRPNLAHQGVLLDHLASLLEQNYQDFEGFAGKRDGLSVALERPAKDVYAELAELEDFHLFTHLAKFSFF
jgi:hypothetical protein